MKKMFIYATANCLACYTNLLTNLHKYISQNVRLFLSNPISIIIEVQYCKIGYQVIVNKYPDIIKA